MKNLFLIGLLLLLGACTPTKPMEKGSTASLNGTKWILEETLGEQQISLYIEKERISGNASCNNYFAELKTDKEKGIFLVDNIGYTKKLCTKMSAENYFFSMLEKVNAYRWSGDILELYKDNVLLLKFKKNG